MTTPIAGVGALSAAQPTATPSSSSANGSLSSDAFLKLIVAQLQNQDPTQPTDTSAFMTQTATLNQIESTQQMTDAMSLLLRNGLSQQATALVGRTVTYQDADGKTQTGKVTGATFSGAAPQLQIAGAAGDVALGSVTSVISTTT